jgi:hypothetical protein
VNPAWWAAFGPADTSVQCGDGKHRLRWADGTLQAVDHPDAEGELVLGALGGDTSPCLDLVAAWGKHCDDLAVLAIGPRSATDKLTIRASVLDEITAVSVGGTLAYHGLGNPVMRHGSSGGGFIRRRSAASAVIFAGHSGGSPRRMPTPMAARAIRVRHAHMLRRRLGAPRAGWSGFASAGTHSRLISGWGVPEADETSAELIRLLAFGPPFQFRLSAAVAHAWSANGANAGRAERARPVLTAALAGRLALAARAWLDIDPEEVEVSLHDGAGWGALKLTKTGGTGQLQARLPVGWLASVWAPGFAVADGHLIVSVLDAAWPTARVLAIRSPGRDPAEQTIRNDQGHWSVTSR